MTVLSLCLVVLLFYGQSHDVRNRCSLVVLRFAAELIAVIGCDGNEVVGGGSAVVLDRNPSGRSGFAVIPLIRGRSGCRYFEGCRFASADCFIRGLNGNGGLGRDREGDNVRVQTSFIILHQAAELVTFVRC